MNKFSGKIKYLIILQTILVIIAVFLMGFMIQRVLQLEQNREEFQKMQKTYVVEVKKVGEEKEERKIAFDELRQVNQEIFGWLHINGTSIDYPIMQAKDNTKYLTKSFKNEWSIVGSAFADFRVNDDSKNIIIYGHNMGKRKEEMFSKLLNYKKIEWANKHADIDFYGLKVNYHLRVFSMFEMPADELKDVLKIDFADESTYHSFLVDINQKSIYQMGVKLDSNKKMVMLVTCENGNDKNRFVVCALEK